jgi:hypothetical protein
MELKGTSLRPAIEICFAYERLLPAIVYLSLATSTALIFVVEPELESTPVTI